MVRQFIYILFALILFCAACQRSAHSESLGYDWSDCVGKNAEAILEQLHKDGIETSYAEDRYTIDMYDYQEHQLQEIINDLEYKVTLRFGSYEETGEAVLQSCVRIYESAVNPGAEVMEKLQKTLNDIVKKYGEPDWISQEVDLKNVFAEEEAIIFMTWDRGIEYQIRRQSGELVVKWQIMSEEHYGRRGYSG